MRKFLVGLLIVGLGLLLGLPGAVGFLLERQGPGLIQNLDASLGQYEIRAGTIQRRWFSSQVELHVRHADGRALATYPLTLRHGPWARGPAWLAAEGALIGPGNEAYGQLSWALRLRTGLTATLILEQAAGAVGEARLELASGYRQGRLSVPRWDGPGVSGLTGALVFDAEAGEATVDATVEALQSPNFLSRGVQLDADVDWATPWLNLDVRYVAANHTLPELDGALTPFSLRVRLAHLDQRVLNEALRLRDSASLLALLPALLDGQPRLEALELAGDHALGTFAGSMLLELTERPAAGFLSSMERLMAVLAGRGDYRVDPALLRALLKAQLASEGVPPARRPPRIDAVLGQLQTSGILGPLPDGQVGGDFSLSQGELRFNGQLTHRWQSAAQPGLP